MVILNFCRIMKLYFPDFIHWLSSLKDPRKFWIYETEVMLMTVIMKNVCCIGSMQQMTDEFIKDECVKNLCTALGVPEHEFLPHYVTINEFLPHCLKKVLDKGTENEQAVYYHHVLEAKLVLGDGFVVSIGTEFIENLDGTIAETYPRKGRVNRKQHMEWVPEIDYRGYSLTLLALEVKETEEKTGKTRTLTFQ